MERAATTPVGPLHDVRVVVLSGLGPVPFVSMLLADQGADVVRVTRPPHHAKRAMPSFDALTEERDVVHRGVRSVPVDLKSEEGLASVLAMVAAADVFVEGYRPGVAERMGLSPERLLEVNPALVYARITGYGQDGPFALAAGHDLNYVAMSGALGAFPSGQERPRPPINLLGDYSAGGLMAAFGITSALLHARSSGQGQVVDVAMVDGVALLTAKIQSLRSSGMWHDVPGTNSIDSGAPFYDTYRCADGRYLAVGAVESDFFRVFLDGLGVDTSQWPAQDDEPAWPRLRELIAAVIEAQPSSHWMAVYDGTDACVSEVLTFDEAAEHPHLRARGVYQDVDGVLHPAPAPRFSATPSRDPRTAPPAAATAQDVVAAWSAPRS